MCERGGVLLGRKPKLTGYQYAEKELGNRDYFLNKPYGVG